MGKENKKAAIAAFSLSERETGIEPAALSLRRLFS
jgi:hypothetical protein